MNATKRTQNNFIVDAIGYMSFWVLISTGIIMKYILLPGRERGAQDPTIIMGLGRHDWGNVHFWASIIFVSAIALHLVLHWSWIIGVFNKMFQTSSKKVLVPALILPILIAFFPLFGTQGIGEEEGHGTPKSNNTAYASSMAALPFSQYAVGKDSCETTALTAPTESHDINGFIIRGRTTFEEIEKATGVKIEDILLTMNLPASISKTERISFLKEQYGFEMDKIREVVKQLASK